MNFLVKLLITAVVAFGLSTILSGVHIQDFKQALVLSLVLAFLNAIVKPLLIILTLPITIFTLGIFLFVINALIILLADYLLDGIKVDGFWWALLFSLLLSLTSGFVQSMFTKDERQDTRR